MHVTANATPCQVCQARLNFSLPPSLPLHLHPSAGTSLAAHQTPRLPGVPHSVLISPDQTGAESNVEIISGRAAEAPAGLPLASEGARPPPPLLCGEGAGKEGQGRPTNPAGNAPSSPSLPCWNPGRVDCALPGDPRPLGSRSRSICDLPSPHPQFPLSRHKLHK